MSEDTAVVKSRLAPSPVRTRPPDLEEPSLSPGTVLFEQWQLVRELGRGGFGAVFEARELNLDQLQAVKVLYPSMVTREESLRRFRREVRTMRSLSHAHIGRVFDYREDRDRDLALISMELVPGGTVRDLLDFSRGQGEDVPLALVWAILEQTLEALAEAHRQKVMHRDVAPGNVLLSGGSPADLIAASEPDPGVKLVDFGIAGLLDVQRTLPGRGLGTVAYMAPEVLASEEVTPAADVYGVGAVIYELLTGEPPLGRFEVPSRLRPAISRAFDRLLLDCLERRPGRRPSAEAALDRCRRLIRPAAARDDEEETRTGSVALVGNGGGPPGADGEPWVSEVMLATGGQAVDPPPESGEAPVPAKHQEGRSAGLLAAAAGLFVLALGLGALLRDLWVGVPEQAETPGAVGEPAKPGPAGAIMAAEGEVDARPEASDLRPASMDPARSPAEQATANGSGRKRQRRAAGTDSDVIQASSGRQLSNSPGDAAGARAALLRIDWSPQDVESFVYLDGRSHARGKTPLTVSLPPGRHEVRVVSKGCGEHCERLTADPGGDYSRRLIFECPNDRETEVRPLVPSPGSTASASRFEWVPYIPWKEPVLGLVFVYLSASELPGEGPREAAGRPGDEIRPSLSAASRPFWMSEADVTETQWWQVMGSPPRSLRCGDCRVENFSWDEAWRFCNRLSRQSRFRECYRWPACEERDEGVECGEVQVVPDCDGYRLPREAERESAERHPSLRRPDGYGLRLVRTHRPSTSE